MTTINLYLNFNGNTEEAFNFYKTVFDGQIMVVMCTDKFGIQWMVSYDAKYN